MMGDKNNMTMEQAVDYVYASYLKAEPHLEYDAPDSVKRNPALSESIISDIWAQKKTPTVLVTGSKGKGSVSKMIATIMGVHKRVGLMTSPHILRFNERFQIGGEPVEDTVMTAAIEAVKASFDAVEQTLSLQDYISPMAIQAAAALTMFCDADAQFQVMECGKGVAYDDVNNVPHSYAVINKIFLEHTRELGATLAEIAENKAAIMIGNRDVVQDMIATEAQKDSTDEVTGHVAFTAAQSPEVMQVLERRAREAGWELRSFGRDFWCENITYTVQGMFFDVVTQRKRYEGIRIPLLGTYQAENCALAMALCEEVLGDTLDFEVVKGALKWLEWPGRLEILSSDPVMLLDACINRTSCANVLEALQQLGISRVNTIIGIPSDKDYQGVAEEMAAVSAQIILTKSSNAHYKFGPEQATILQEKGIPAEWAESFAEALQLARTLQEEAEIAELPLIILGTTSLISDVKRFAKVPMPL